mmetsp:Transcript_16497/g.34731  ORF Transcript_16497/g.34731 Transcript_16497/m.34731 type:complete len:177 (-) Transcript_16497:239-769(-)
MSATPPSSSTKMPLQSINATNASCQVTRAVRTMSSINHHRTSIRTTFRKYFYSPTHFPKILGAVMVASGIVGYTSMGWWHGRQIEKRKRIYIEAYNGSSDESTTTTRLENSSVASSSTPGSNAGVTIISSDAKNRMDGENDNRLIALARKMTYRVVSSPSSTVDSSRLQRQVTKFW